MNGDAARPKVEGISSSPSPSFRSGPTRFELLFSIGFRPLYIAGAFWAAASIAIWAARAVVTARSRRNYLLPVLLLGLGIADGFFLLAIAQNDTALALQRLDTGLLCMAVIALLVGRRVIPFFAMRAVPGLTVPMHESSAVVQLIAGIAAVLLSFGGFGVPLAVALTPIAAISVWQLLTWQPWAVRKNPLLWILYIGYGGIAAGLLMASLHALGVIQSAAPHTHVIAIGGFSVLIIGMVTRTSLGHLARPLVLDRSMQVSYVLMLTALVLRMLALVPSSWSVIWLQLSAVAWISVFALYLARFGPMMLRAHEKPSGSPKAS